MLIALVAPSVSTSVRFLTTALASASWVEPIDSRPETKAGMPVGIAEMAIAVPSSSSWSAGIPRISPTTTMTATAPQAMMPSTLVSESSSRCSGDRVRVTEVSIVAIWPIWVCIPVAVTTIVAVPRVTEVFWNSMLVRSPSADVGGAQHPGILGDRRALTGERGLLGLEGRRAHDAPVGRHDVAGLELDDVARHHVGRRDERDRPVAHHPGLRHLHLGQGVDAGAGGELLPGAEADVEHHEQGRRAPRWTPPR